ncbi:MAG: response regulator [Lachnospiraceae bacterium]|nr:response regulator [Lachnospiraceae bacterium]
MYEQEKQKAVHLMILIFNTVFIAILAVGAIYFKLDMWASVLFFIGLITSWFVHIMGKIPESIRLWMYIILAMLAYSYFGIYEMGLFDLASVIMILILICTATEEYAFVRLCAFTYLLTMIYKINVVYDSILDLQTEDIIRILCNIALVFAGERLAETILQRRRKERERADERITRLEEANRSVEDFLTNVSHELRTPINAVTGITTVMLKNEEDTEKKKDILSIQMAGNRLFSQIEDILDYTEIDTGRIIVSEENYMIFSIINDIIVENHLTKWDKDMELIFDIDAGIPSVLLGDGRKIKKIIKHLIDNAVKFTKKGGVYVRVYALQKNYGINLCIRVSDTGIGMTEEEMERITEKFVQANGGRNRKVGGLGLGLSIVYGMVSAMNGFIRLESEDGRGTTVSVSIPQKVVDAAPSMEVQNRDELCIALYLKPEKYEIPEIRDYYNATITHLVQGLDLTVHRVFDSEELKKLIGMYQLTHLVIGKEEYEENASYFEKTDNDMEIVVVADDDFVPEENSRINFMRKPFYCLPIVNVLNAKTSFVVDEFERDKNMLCPGVRVLVVDDEPMNLMVAEGIFKDYQMRVRTAEGGIAAIEICKKEDFDLIFLDHMMPEMDGVETLKRLRKIQTDAGKTYTIIAFTANAVSGAREMFLQEGFDEFISKPIEDHELRRLLKKVLPKNSIIYAEGNGNKKSHIEEYGENMENAAAGHTDAGSDSGQKPVFNNVTEQDKFTRLNEMGFHTMTGLQYCRGDREFYEAVLIKYAKDAEHKITDIDASFRGDDIKNYQIMVHALKSSSRMVGAGVLSEMAKDLEDAAKNQDLAYIKENHNGLIDKYRETVQNILDVLEPDIMDAPEEEPVTGTEISKDEFNEKLLKLKNSLDTFEADTAETLITEMKGLVYQGKAVSEIMRDIRQDVDDFELGTAAQKVEALIDSIEGGEE